MSGVAGHSGPPGNTNSANGKRYRAALERALAHEFGSVDDGLFATAKARVAKMKDGDQAACEHIAERFDGKPHQTSDVNVSGTLTQTLAELPHVDVPAKA